MNPILTLRPDDKQSTPLYLQLARNLEAAIHAGQWKSEQALPSERALSEQLSISRSPPVKPWKSCLPKA
jgi:GntR family transcriptional regulator